MPYALALDYYKVWWEDYAEKVARFDALCRCIAGGSEPRRIELLKLGADEIQKTV